MLLFTDLDNTMIYSHRHVTDKPIVWVEELRGHKQSYMTLDTYSFFEKQRQLKVVPLTTRTLEQYMRLSASLNLLGWHDVLICNGAIRICDGKEDLSWREESIRVAEKDSPFFADLLHDVKQEYPKESIVIVEPFLFYIKTDTAEETYEKLKKKADSSHLLIMRDSRKVYCLPKSLNKGTAVERYRKMTDETDIWAAGDSLFDLPMLERADVCLYPESLSDDLEKKENRLECYGIFSDSICEYMRKMIMKE